MCWNVCSSALLHRDYTQRPQGFGARALLIIKLYYQSLCNVKLSLFEIQSMGTDDSRDFFMADQSKGPALLRERAQERT